MEELAPIDLKEKFVRDEQRNSALLARSQLFRSVDIETVSSSLSRCHLRELEPGHVLLSPELENRFLYLVISGRLGIHLETPEQPPISIVEPGECVGEMSLIENKNPSAFVVATEPTRVMSVPEPVFWELLDASIQINRNMLHIMSLRVRLSTLLVAESLNTQKACMRDATIDALTGLHNRRWLDDMFEQELVHSSREGLPLCLLMMDVDHFKSYNDRYGHVAGDRALTGVAEGLRGALRPTDMLARYGGEEFALLLPHTEEANALTLAERLRRTVAEIRVQDANGGWLPKVTVSVGVSAGRGQDLATLISDADAALYRAKKAGRNRVSL